MRICFFAHRYHPSVGGVEKYVHQLAKAVRDMGHDTFVIAGAAGPEQASFDEHDGIPVYRFPAYRSPMRCAWWFRTNRALFQNADVIHVSNTHMLEYLHRMMGNDLARHKIFLTRHGMACTHPVPRSHVDRARRSLALCAGVAHDGAFIEKWLGVRPDICPPQGLSPTADELPEIPEPPPDSAVFIGRLESDSGIRIYIDCVRLLRDSHGRTLQLNVFGDGSLMGELRGLAARAQLPVSFHGKVANAQDHIPAACFAFLDGRMAIQEAMARRRLVFAAYVDPLKRDYVCGESFSHCLEAAGNAAEFADRVLWYMNHPAERALRVAQAFAYARYLSWPRTARAHLQLWTHGRAACTERRIALQSVSSLERTEDSPSMTTCEIAPLT